MPFIVPVLIVLIANGIDIPNVEMFYELLQKESDVIKGDEVECEPTRGNRFNFTKQNLPFKVTLMTHQVVQTTKNATNFCKYIG